MPAHASIPNPSPIAKTPPALSRGGAPLLFFAIAGLSLLPPAHAAGVAGQSGWVSLRGNTRPEAKAANDRGRVPDEMMLDHLMLQLQRTAEQEQSLQQFIKEVHDPASPLFHHWLTAAQFGERYGASSSNVARVTSWLESEGFKVNLVYPNHMVVDFSGSAGQIRQALHTEIHQLQVKGQAHFANMSDPQIPAALAPAVAGVVSLNDFRPRPMLRQRAKYTAGGGYDIIVPADLATIYNFNPAFAAGISGQGQTIVLIEDTNVYAVADWNTFRSTFGLSTAYPLGSMTQVHPGSATNNCTDPGYNGDDVEATLDVEWASAAAPSATIELASCADTSTNFGGFVALQNLLNSSATPPAIVSISYGESESYQGASYNTYISSLYAQGVAEGVSIFVSSGDEGAASSDADSLYAVSGITVSGFTSTPYNVSVGGTDFGDTYQGLQGTYWNTANTATYGSALSYIPEIPWNDSCASVLLGDYTRSLPTYGAGGFCNDYSDLTTASGSGGPSGCATGAPDIPGVVGGTCAGFPKPSWQAGFIGNPNDGVRDIPDVSLFSANGVWGHYYAFCFSDPMWGYSCAGAPSTWAGAGGTSFAAPIMAGVQSLVNEASGTRWGNPNPSYYALAAAEYGSGGNASCSSALGNAAASNCIFYDVTPLPLLYTGTGTGGDIDVPCLGVNCYAPGGGIGVLSTAPQPLSSVSVTSLGYSYTSAPSCSLSGGGGSGAACAASITGVVSSSSLTNGGSGYTYYPINCTISGGGGTGAGCEAFICEEGNVCAVYLTSYGSGYTSNPTCTVSGGGGSGATCSATKSQGIATSLTAPGSGYTTMPLCTLSGGGGSGGMCAALATNSSDAYQPAFGTTTGWDFATGIGTVNVANLVASFGLSVATLSTSDLTFSPQPLYTTSAAGSVTMTNTGTSKLSILAVTVGGTNANDFAKSADTCSGATLVPNGTCSVSVTFTPSATGSLGATLSFADLAPHSPQTVTLSGTGVGVGVELSPASLTFADQSPGSSSAAQTITLTNTGNLALNITSIATTGNNPGDFTQTHTCGSTLGVGASCGIQITFTPSALGSRSAALTIADNVMDSPQSVSLSGVGANPMPFLSSTLMPTSVAPGGPGFTLTVNGTGFASGATVEWNGVALATTFVGSETLTAVVPAADIATPGTASISVANSGSNLTSNVVLFPVAAPAITAAFTSASGSPIPAGNSPRSVVVGDFNGDGKLDVAVANAGNNTLTVLMGKGDGTFSLSSSTPYTGSSPLSLAVGDFNGDGKLDLATANWGQNSVSVLLGNGDGTFPSANSFQTTGSQPYSVAVGDFRGIGVLDIAVANKNSNNLTILLGNGDGTFTAATASPATGNWPMAVAVGDLNGDGKLDLAVVNASSDTLTILLGNGDGTFTPTASPATGYDPMGVAVGDFNGDGKLDLAVANVSSGNLTILLGKGDGTFKPAASPATGSGPISVAVGDFNADGKLDLAVANLSSNNLTILLGNGDGTFAPAASPATGSNPMGVAVGDFNGDGSLDLAVANGGANNVSILLQSAQAPLAGASPTGLTFSGQALGSTSASNPVTFSNTGAAALIIASITTSGDFSPTNNCGNILKAGAHCTINVTFTPTATGARPGTLTITDNNKLAAGSMQTVSLTGTGANSVPAIISLSPTSAALGAAAQTLTIAGTSFLTTSTVTYNSVAHSPTFISSTQLTIPLSVSDQASAGGFAVVVANPAPGGGASNAVNFNVSKATPVITWATPAAITYGTALSATQLDANSNVPGTFVYNPAAGTIPLAGTDTLSVTFSPYDTTDYTAASAKVTLMVNNPAPAISSLSPASATAGAAAATLTINGAKFLSTSKVTYNGIAHTPNLLSTTQLKITLSASDLSSAGTYAVDVTNPAPGGGSSNAVNFVVNSPVAGVSPGSLAFGNSNVGLTSASQPVALSNTGNAPLAISGIAITANFAETNTCAGSLAAGGHCTISVTFSPTATGSLAGSLTITDNSHGAAGSKQTVNLTGTGLAAVALTLSPASANVARGATQAFTATISNTSNTTLNWYVNGVLNGNSTQGTLTGTGLTRTYKAPTAKVPSPNPAVVQVVSVADPTKSKTASVKVTP